jgi:hypothetical protein
VEFQVGAGGLGLSSSSGGLLRGDQQPSIPDLDESHVKANDFMMLLLPIQFRVGLKLEYTEFGSSLALVFGGSA